MTDAAATFECYERIKINSSNKPNVIYEIQNVHLN